jgi:uncharacterized SAM-binding protein YcdF (DUF218 family)
METMLFFLQPLGLAWLGLGSWTVWSTLQRRQQELLLASTLWLLLTLTSCTCLPSLLLASLETAYPIVALKDLPSADAIVCLGGGASPAHAEPVGIHLRGPADRVATAVLLANEGKAPTLVLGGGQYRVQREWRSEADAVAAVLRDQEFDAAEIISLGHCTNTRHEALKVARLAQTRGWKQMYLVSSAYHLSRAVGTFQRAGLDVIPIPCNFQSAIATGEPPTWISPPSVSALGQFQLWSHETLGAMSYRWRRWL